MATEKFTIKTLNGSVEITRTATKATIKEVRTCYGFKEESTIVITKLDDTCMHQAFGSKQSLTEAYKNN